MWWRMPRAVFDKAGKDRRKAGMRRIVKKGRVPGILAYDEGRPVGWAQIAPRTEQPVLERSHVLGSIDDKTVWSLSCFFIDKEYRVPVAVYCYSDDARKPDKLLGKYEYRDIRFNVGLTDAVFDPDTYGM